MRCVFIYQNKMIFSLTGEFCLALGVCVRERQTGIEARVCDKLQYESLIFNKAACSKKKKIISPYLHGIIEIFENTGMTIM